tara:strand:- start:252 stop:836 length:585 start_codon:yes stop_codon:yes gene_type:complete
MSNFKENWRERQGLKPKTFIRKETQEEFVMRTIYETSDTKMEKPRHMDNPKIIKQENWGKKPQKWDGYTNISTDTKQQLMAWDVYLPTITKPKTPEDRKALVETKRMLNKDYNNPTTRKYLDEKELKLIGKHPSQIKIKETPKILVPEPVVFREPQKPVEQLIKEHSDFRLKQEQEAYDQEYGTEGLASLNRPK